MADRMFCIVSRSQTLYLLLPNVGRVWTTDHQSLLSTSTPKHGAFQVFDTTVNLHPHLVKVPNKLAANLLALLLYFSHFHVWALFVSNW